MATVMTELVNLGSLCIDHVYGVPNLTGAGETVASLSHAVFPGGKGLNQSLAAVKAGARVAHVGCVGGDGGFLVDLLRDNAVDVTGIRTLADAVSGHAVIQVNSRGENAIVIAGGANRLLAVEDFDAAFSRLADGDWLLLQNEINNLEGALERAGRTPAKVAFNAAPVDGRETGYDLSFVDLLIVNQIEAAALCQLEPGVAGETLVSKLQQRYVHMTVVLTQGVRGLIFAPPGEQPASLPAFTVTTVDETAAGDAFIGYCLEGLISGVPLVDALVAGSAAGALAVTRAGAASSIPDAASVRQLVRETSGR